MAVPTLMHNKNGHPFVHKYPFEKLIEYRKHLDFRSKHKMSNKTTTATKAQLEGY